jgi:type IV secretory pathway TrbL component
MITLPEVLFNRVATAFSVALDGAYASLHIYSIGLLAVLATMYFMVAMGQGLVGYITLGEALGSLFWIVIKIGVFYFVLVVLYDLMWNAAFRTFIKWGADAGGGRFPFDRFMEPGSLVRQGFVVAYPIKVWLDQFIGLSLPFYVVDFLLMLGAYWTIIFAFGMLALHVLMALIEMKMAIATGAILIPWGVLTQTAFFAEMSISWMASGLVRVLLTALLMGIALPLFELLALPVPSFFGPDPTVVQSVGTALGAIVFAALAWVLPGRAAGMAGRGVALGLGADHVVAGGLMGVRAVTQLAGGAIRNVNRVRYA